MRPMFCVNAPIKIKLSKLYFYLLTIHVVRLVDKEVLFWGTAWQDWV